MGKIRAFAIAIVAVTAVVIPTATSAHADVWTGNRYRDYIIQHESSGNPWAVNPSSGTMGLFQCHPRWHSCPALGDVAGQLAWGERYMQGRYGTWYNAYVFWTNNHWW